MKKQTVGVYLIKDDKILFLVRQKKNDTVHPQGHYLPIGGKVEPSERIEDAAKREVAEESGIKINSLELSGILYVLGQGTGEHDWINFLFRSTDFSGEPKTGNEGSFAWVDFKDIAKANTYAGDQMYLPYLIEKRFFVIEFHYQGFEYIDHTLLHLGSH